MYNLFNTLGLRTIIYEHKFQQILKIVDLAGINFSDFAITCFCASRIHCIPQSCMDNIENNADVQFIWCMLIFDWYKACTEVMVEMVFYLFENDQ